MHVYSVCRLIPLTVLGFRIITKSRIAVNITAECLFPVFRKFMRLKNHVWMFFLGSGSLRDHQQQVLYLVPSSLPSSPCHHHCHPLVIIIVLPLSLSLSSSCCHPLVVIVIVLPSPRHCCHWVPTIHPMSRGLQQVLGWLCCPVVVSMGCSSS